MKSCYLLVIFAVAACLFSCHSNNGVIYDNLDNEVTTKNDHSDEYYGDFAEEVTYDPTTTEDFDGIYSPDYYFYKNNYFYNLKKEISSDNGTRGYWMISYTNLTNGKMSYMCTDPLCTHNDINECDYLDLQLSPGCIIDNYIYATRLDIVDDSGLPYSTIYRIDMTNGTIKMVFKCKDDLSSMLISIKGSYNNKLYFVESIQSIEINDNKETTTKQTQILYTLDSKNQKSEIIDIIPENYVDIGTELIYINNNVLFFKSITGLFTTDYSLNNEQIIYKFTGSEQISNFYYDINKNEYYFGIRDDNANTGIIYVSKNGAPAEKCKMPSENIYSFQLTNSKIYYSVYDPISFGGSSHGDAIDYTGGKIYVINRNDISKSELFFDCGNEFVLYNGYVVIGDYVYFDYLEIVRGETGVYFSTATKLKVVRINVKEHTIKYLRFE